MKRNHLRLLACFLIACMAISVSCKKDKDKSRSELIVGSWILTADVYSPAYDYFGNGTGITDAFSLYDDCIKDNISTFKSDNTGISDEGVTKCDPADDQAVPFAWQLSDNDSKLVISTYGDTYNIIQLDNSALKISMTFAENGTTYTNTYTFKRK